MNDSFTVECTNKDCGVLLELEGAPETWAGQTVECPSCTQSILIPAGSAEPACPQCGATMSADAVLCISCGYDSRTGKSIQPSAKPVVAKAARPSFLTPKVLISSVAALVLVAAVTVVALKFRAKKVLEQRIQYALSLPDTRSAIGLLEGLKRKHPGDKRIDEACGLRRKELEDQLRAQAADKYVRAAITKAEKSVKEGDLLGAIKILSAAEIQHRGASNMEELTSLLADLEQKHFRQAEEQQNQELAGRRAEQEQRMAQQRAETARRLGQKIAQERQEEGPADDPFVNQPAAADGTRDNPGDAGPEPEGGGVFFNGMWISHEDHAALQRKQAGLPAGGGATTETYYETVSQKCSKCKGKGYRAGLSGSSSKLKCLTCKGKGKIDKSVARTRTTR